MVDHLVFCFFCPFRHGCTCLLLELTKTVPGAFFTRVLGNFANFQQPLTLCQHVAKHIVFKSSCRRVHTVVMTMPGKPGSRHVGRQKTLASMCSLTFSTHNPPKSLKTGTTWRILLVPVTFPHERSEYPVSEHVGRYGDGGVGVRRICAHTWVKVCPVFI